MEVNLKIAWSASHQEFIISDYYYFGWFDKKLREKGIVIDEVDEFERLENYDVIVFNYPEIWFSDEEKNMIDKWLNYGKKIMFLAYYKNEDRVAELINDVVAKYGLKFNYDHVKDDKSNWQGDPYYVVTSELREYSEGVSKICFPCTASIELSDGYVIAKTEDERVIAAGKKVGKGLLEIYGTCVFWDSFSAKILDNFQFSCNILTQRAK